MRKVDVYKLKDGRVFDDYQAAWRAAEEARVDAVCNLARFVLNLPDKYQGAINMISDRVRFQTLTEMVQEVNDCTADLVLVTQDDSCEGGWQ